MTRALITGVGGQDGRYLTDLLLADGKIDGRERRFLQRLASSFRIPAGLATNVIDTMLVKNHL